MGIKINLYRYKQVVQTTIWNGTGENACEIIAEFDPTLESFSLVGKNGLMHNHSNAILEEGDVIMKISNKATFVRKDNFKRDFEPIPTAKATEE